MLRWLLNNRVRESWSRYSVAVYLGLLLAGTLSAEPPRPPEAAFEPSSFEAAPPWLMPAERDAPEPPSDPLRHIQQR